MGQGQSKTPWIVTTFLPMFAKEGTEMTLDELVVMVDEREHLGLGREDIRFFLIASIGD